MAVRGFYGGRLKRRYIAEIVTVRYSERMFRLGDIGQPANSPPTLIAYTEVADWTTLSTSKATGSLTWQTGDLIVVIGATSNTAAATITSVTATGLTFTAGATNTAAGSCWGGSWSAVAGSSGSGAITAACDTGARPHGIAVWQFRGSAGLGATGINATSAKTLSITRTGSQSFAVEGIFDFGSGAITGRVWQPTGQTERQAVLASGFYAAFVADWGNQGAAGTTSYGISGTASTDIHTKIVLEVLGTSSAPSVAEAGLAPLALTAAGTGRKVAPQGGSVSLGVATTGRATKVALAGSDVYGDVYSDTYTGGYPAPLGLAGAGTARKVAPQSGSCPLGLTTRGTAARKQPQTGAAPLGVTTTALDAKRAVETGAAPLGIGAAGTARHLGTSGGAAPLTVAATGAGRKVTAQSGVCVLGLTTRGIAVRRQAQAGAVAVGVAATGAGRKVGPQAGTNPVALAATGRMTKVAVGRGPAVLGVAATGTALKRAPAAGTAPLTLVTYNTSALVPRAQTGTCPLGITTSGTARRVAPQAGRAASAVATSGAAAKRSPTAGVAAMAAMTRTGAAAGHGTAGRACLGVSGTASGRKVAGTAGACPLAVTGTGRVVKRATPAGMAALPLITVGGAVTKRAAARGVTVVGLTATYNPAVQARQVSGRLLLALVTWHKDRRVRRPFSGVTARPVADYDDIYADLYGRGVTVRPYTGSILRP